MNKNKLKRINKNDNFLEYVPQVKYNHWENNSGIVTLFFYRNTLFERLICFLFKKSKVTDLKLDEISSSVWLMIDGKSTVGDINKLLCEKTGDDFETSCKRLIMFFRYVLHRGWINF